MSQINYKLCEYEKAMKTYLNILIDNKSEIESEDVSDIIVNYLACQSSIGTGSNEEIEQTLKPFEGFEMTYEYYFNLSQVYLKDGLNEESYKCLRDAYEKAVKDDQFKDDMIRFKV